MDELVKKFESMRKHLVAPIIILTVCALISFFCFTLSPITALVMLSLCAVSYYFFYHRKRKKFVEQYKNTVINAVLSDYFDNLQFTPSRGFDKEQIKSMGMIEMGNIYRSEDYFSASYNGVNFESADVYIADETSDSEGHSNSVVYFKGRWMIFDFNKNFKYDLQVREKGFSYAKKSGGFFSSGPTAKKIKTENELFNNSYFTYAIDEHEAYYILTPPIMENMIKLKQSTKGKLMFCFTANKLHIALHNSIDSFEPSIFSKITVQSVSDSVLSEIKPITDFIDELQLDKKIWNK